MQNCNKRHNIVATLENNEQLRIKMSTPKQQSTSRAYNAVIKSIDRYVPNKMRPFWLHPAGPKTIFFWAPLFKWGLVIAGISDMLNRPVDQISMKQSASLALTGFIWSRYSTVIIPKNWSLFAVNFFVGSVQLVQCARAYQYQLTEEKLKTMQFFTEIDEIYYLG